MNIIEAVKTKKPIRQAWWYRDNGRDEWAHPHEGGWYYWPESNAIDNRLHFTTKSILADDWEVKD